MQKKGSEKETTRKLETSLTEKSPRSLLTYLSNGEQVAGGGQRFPTYLSNNEQVEYRKQLSLPICLMVSK